MSSSHTPRLSHTQPNEPPTSSSTSSSMASPLGQDQHARPLLVMNSGRRTSGSTRTDPLDLAHRDLNLNLKLGPERDRDRDGERDQAGDRSSVYTERSIHSLPEGEGEEERSGSTPGPSSRSLINSISGKNVEEEASGVNEAKAGRSGEEMLGVKSPLTTVDDTRVEWDEVEVGKPSESSSGDLAGDEEVSSSTTIRGMNGALSSSDRGRLGSSVHDDQVHRDLLGASQASQQQHLMTAYPRFRVNSMNAVVPASRRWMVEDGSRVEVDSGLRRGPGAGAATGFPMGAQGRNDSFTKGSAGIGFPLAHPNLVNSKSRQPPPGKMRMRIKSIDPSIYPRLEMRGGNNNDGSVSSSGYSTPAGGPSSPVRAGSGEMTFSPPGSPRKVRVRRSSGFGSVVPIEDGGPSEEELKRLRDRRGKAWNTVNEMGQSEERFRKGLNVIIDLFLDPLSQVVGTDGEMLTVRQIKQIFGNIREIEALSERMEEALNKCVHSDEDHEEGHGDIERHAGAQMKRLGEIKRGHGTLTRSSSAPALFQKAKAREEDGTDPVPKVSGVLLAFLPYLSLYYPFITAFPTIPSTLNEMHASNSKFAAFVRSQEEQVRCHRLGLCHWLLTVIQRIPRWTILIENLHKVTDDPVEYEALGRAHAMSEKVTENINERLKEQTAVLTLVNLQKAFDGLRRPLVSPARKLLKKGVLRQNSNCSHEIWLFLFNDILVCAKASGGTSVTSSMLSQWIYTAEGSLSAFASGMAQVISHSSTQTRAKGSRPSSVVENSFTCTAWIEVEDMTIFALEGERDAARREKAFQITSPLESMELLAEDHTEKETWLMALNDAKYGRLADLQTIQQTATIRQAKRKSLHAVSRRSSSSAFSVAQDPNYMPIEDLILAVEADGYNSPVVQEAGRSNGACGQCRAVFTLMKAPHPCLLACGKLFCSDCLVQTFTITGDPTGKLRAACDACYRSVFRSPAPTEHEVLDAHVNFTLSRHSLGEDQHQRQKSIGGADDVSALTSTPATSRTSSRATDGTGIGKAADNEPSQAVKKLRELLQRAS